MIYVFVEFHFFLYMNRCIYYVQLFDRLLDKLIIQFESVMLQVFVVSIIYSL